MHNSIQYFAQFGINNMEKVIKSFLERSENFADLVNGLRNEVLNLVLNIISETLNNCNEMVLESYERKEKWHVVRTDQKQLLTSVGTVRGMPKNVEKAGLDWHSGFYTATRLELLNEPFSIEREYLLNEQPIRIDVLVKNQNNFISNNEIAQMFREINVIEYNKLLLAIKVKSSIFCFYSNFVLYLNWLFYAYLFFEKEKDKQENLR